MSHKNNFLLIFFQNELIVYMPKRNSRVLGTINWENQMVGKRKQRNIQKTNKPNFIKNPQLNTRTQKKLKGQLITYKAENIRKNQRTNQLYKAQDLYEALPTKQNPKQRLVNHNSQSLLQQYKRITLKQAKTKPQQLCYTPNQ